MPSRKPAAAKAAKSTPKDNPKPALAKAAAERPRCGNCPFLDEKPGAAGHICKRFPQGVLKGLNDWCGEHPDFKVAS